ncbi:MAG: mechanosensitive ion channel [Myxococcales bacterium]|nr:mechanosensitive ion channel [Myxococcales bacterium]
MTTVMIMTLSALGHAQDDSSSVTSSTATTTTTTTTPTSPVFYGREDVESLEEALARAKAAFETALEHWKDNKHPTSISGNNTVDTGQALRSAEQQVRALETQLKKARTAPSRALVKQRFLYDLEVDRLAQIHHQLTRKGDIHLALAAAGRELKNLLETSHALQNASAAPSPISDRLSAAEKLDEQIRLTEEQLATVQRLHEHLDNQLFENLLRVEQEVVQSIEVYGEIRQLWRSISNSTRAINYGKKAKSPLEIAQSYITEGNNEQLGIREYWLKLRGFKNKNHFSLERWSGKLAEYQKSIDQLKFLLSRLQGDAERLRSAEAESARSLQTQEDQPVTVSTAASEYVRFGAQITNAENRLEKLRAEESKLLELIKAVELRLQSQRKKKDAAREDLVAKISLLKEHKAKQPLVLPSKGGGVDEQSQFVESFILRERLEAHNEHLKAIRRLVRRIDIQRDVLQRRLQASQDEYKEIIDKHLPRLRRSYYLAVGETIGIRSLRVLVVLFLAYTLLGIIRRGSGPFVEQMVERTLRRQGAATIRAQRARTLMSVFIGASRFVIYILAILFVIGQLDIDYGPLLVAAGGLSLAIGFGAQTLVRDFFAGFFILLEGQYSIGDVVDINGKAGTVEDLNLRTTIIRSIDGQVHTIPNGEITITSNKTKFWSRAVADISVAYEEDIDDVISVLNRVADELQQHEHWAPKVREIEVLGVESLGQSSVDIRVLIETTPGDQWALSREFKRRVKMAFNQLGIEIPWPQHMISHKEEASASLTFAKQQRVRRYIGVLADTPSDLNPPVSIEERDRAEAIANKEAAILEKQRKDEKTEEAQTVNNPSKDEDGDQMKDNGHDSDKEIRSPRSNPVAEEISSAPEMHSKDEATYS